MDLRDLEYFAVVAEYRHLGRAAEALGLGQPALSMSLRRLERSAQTKLVKRTPNGVELTAVGAAVFSHVGKLRLARDDLAREVADLANGRSGHLRVGASPSNAEVLLPQVCSAFLTAAPKVTLTLDVMDNDVLLPGLRRGDIDIALAHTRQLAEPELTLERIREDEFVVYCAANHRLAQRRSVTLEDLAQERWAVASSASGASGPLRRLREAFEQRGLPPPRIAMVTDLVMFKLRVIAASGLLGTMVRANVEAAAVDCGLKILPVKDLDWTRPAVMAYRKDAYLSPAAQRFIEFVKEKALAALGGTA